MELIKGITISFDYDDTLSKPSVQKVAKKLLKEGYNVFVLTSRKSDIDNSDIKEVMAEIGIDKVVYTNHDDKYEYLRDYEADIHVDNDKMEMFLIQRFTHVEVFDVNLKCWGEMLNELLENDG